MNQITTVGLDIAKNVFHAVALDGDGRELGRKMLKRDQVLPWFAQLPVCQVGMEACSGSNYWGRELQKQGHRVGLIQPRSVKAFLRRAKNDFNDARAIGEAVRQPQMRFVPVRTEEQQAIQSLHRLRQGRVGERTRLINQIRGLLSEYGVVVPKGASGVTRKLAATVEPGSILPEPVRQSLELELDLLRELGRRIAHYDKQLRDVQRQDAGSQRLSKIHGIGVVNGTALSAKLGDGQAWRNGREFAASLGLVPRQYSSGGKTVLMGITKRGDAYLRTMLIHGARSVLSHAHRREDRLSRWALEIAGRRGKAKAIVAVANKLARIAWALTRWDREFDPALA